MKKVIKSKIINGIKVPVLWIDTAPFDLKDLKGSPTIKHSKKRKRVRK
tara:strand:- start:1664 stop:1807 length:144 start_codon:yes stop_codon:yes gene_type:complete